MFRPARASSILSLAAAIAAVASAAQADDFRYISTTGRNANDCSRAAPCRSFQRGINTTPTGGELHILDSGYFGPNAVIRRSMTIAGGGNTVLLGNPIMVDRANVVVTLRDLVLTGEGAVLRGIEISDAAAVRVERCAIHGFASSGILMNAAGADLFVSDTTIHGNGGDGMTVNAGTSRLTASNVRIAANAAAGLFLRSAHTTIAASIVSGNGLSVGSGGIVVADGRANITSTVVANNGNDGVLAGALGGNPQVTLQSVVSRGNTGAGLFVEGGTARISDSVFTENGNHGVSNFAVLHTRGNNIVIGNTNGDFAGLAPTPLDPE